MRKCLGLVFAGMLAAASGAFAADPVGNWRFDSDGFRTSMEQIMQSQLAGMDTATQTQAKNMMYGMLSQMTAEMAGVITFKSDGTAAFRRDSGQVETARWEDLGDRIRITPANGEPIGDARIEGDQLIIDSEQTGAPVALQMVWIRQ